MSAAPVLTILKNGETVKSCPIEGEAVLGRAEGCVIRLEDRAISREHAIFKVVDGGVQVERKSEFAPLVVNGIEATRALIKEADVIAIGPYLMKVSVPAQPKTPTLVHPIVPPSQLPSPNETQPLASIAQSLMAQGPEPALPALDSGDAGDIGGLSPIDGGEAAVLPDLGAPGNAPELPSPDGIEGLNAGADRGIEGLGAPGEGGMPGFAPLEGAEAPKLDGALDLGAPEGGLAVDGAPALDGALIDGAPPALEANLALPDEPVEEAQDDAKTKLTPMGKLTIHLVFAPGTANVTDFELVKDEVYIGRGKGCDIVLNDKKSSRKNTIIRRAGVNFTIKDLESANGTYVNGVRITEQELSGDDVIRVGGVEFRFVAKSADYEAREQGFMPVPEDPIELPPGGMPETFDQPYEIPVPELPAGVPAGGPPGLPGALPGAVPGIVGITGIGPADHKRMTLLEKIRNFKDLPRRQQIVIAIIVIGLAYFIFFDDDDEQVATKKPKPKPSAVAPSGPKGPAARTFESLPPDKQAFIESQHALAFDLYKNKEYDQTLFELGKIFELVDDYKDSRDIERYAREGKRKLEALQEEKRRKEEEAALKAKVDALVTECGERMKKKQYEQAKELFTQITLIDPDNQQVAAWKKEIEQSEEDKRAAEQTLQVQGEINKRAWEVYQGAMALKKQHKYHAAIDEFGKVGDIGASDPRPVRLARKQIAACLHAIRSLRDPVLAEAKQAEDAQDFPKAFALYKKATKIDPPHPAGYAGMARIRTILHDRAKVVYTEAILAESYSDFAMARKKFKECLEIAPVDDIYHERSTRKLARYFRKEDGQPQ